MAKFLTTTGISAELEKIIKGAKKQLVLVSPYLQIARTLKLRIEDQDRMKIDIRVVYGKTDYEPADFAWLSGLQSVRVSFCKTLHAKCYMNEEMALITSMNLYEFSQLNNEEMGILVSRREDPELYRDIDDNAQQILRQSVEKSASSQEPLSKGTKTTKAAPTDRRVKSSAKTAAKTATKAAPKPRTKRAARGTSGGKGTCIRCASKIALDRASPYCSKCFKSWNKWKNDAYEEKRCHACGKEHGTSKARPVCLTCFRKSG